MPILKKQFVPPFLAQFPEFKGACIHECIGGNHLPRFVLAESHVYPKDAFRGWICFKNLFCLLDKQLLIHEMSHVLTDYNQGHSDAWRAKVLELGGHLNSYLFQVGTYSHMPACFDRECVTEEGRDPDEVATPIQKINVEKEYAWIAKYNPWRKPENLVLSNKRPLKIQNPITIENLTAISNRQDEAGYLELMDTVTEPVDFGV